MSLLRKSANQRFGGLWVGHLRHLLLRGFERNLYL
jgi:hypothetical protein